MMPDGPRRMNMFSSVGDVQSMGLYVKCAALATSHAQALLRIPLGGSGNSWPGFAWEGWASVPGLGWAVISVRWPLWQVRLVVRVEGCVWADTLACGRHCRPESFGRVSAAACA
jgi:hypothetical protein